MPTHTHISALSFIITALYVVIFLAFFKVITQRLDDDNPLKPAMLFIAS